MYKVNIIYVNRAISVLVPHKNSLAPLKQAKCQWAGASVHSVSLLIAQIIRCHVSCCFIGPSRSFLFWYESAFSSLTNYTSIRNSSTRCTFSLLPLSFFSLTLYPTGGEIEKRTGWVRSVSWISCNKNKRRDEILGVRAKKRNSGDTRSGFSSV